MQGSKGVVSLLCLAHVIEHLSPSRKAGAHPPYSVGSKAVAYVLLQRLQKVGSAPREGEACLSVRSPERNGIYPEARASLRTRLFLTVY